MLEQEFFDYLRSSNIYCDFHCKNDYEIIINKVPYNSKIDMLYFLEGREDYLFDLKSPLKFGGFYDKENNKLYALDYGIRTGILKWDYNDERLISLEDINRNLKNDINNKIKEIINDNVDNIFDISEVELMDEITDRDVITDFMNGYSDTLERFIPKYTKDKPKNILDYLTNKELFIEEESRDFILDNSTQILKGLKMIEIYKKQLKCIEEDENHPYHKVKKIVDAIKKNNCVTVNLTINKNGIEQILKYDADTLKNCYASSYLSTYHIGKLSDRNLFEENFGRSEDLHYEDIVKITYGKNTIYEDDNFKEKEIEEEICI